MAAKIWYKNIKVGDSVLAKLGRTHLWNYKSKDHLLEVEITEIHDGWFYGYFKDPKNPEYKLCIIINYSNRPDLAMHKASIIKKLPNKPEKYEDNEYILGY